MVERTEDQPVMIDDGSGNLIELIDPETGKPVTIEVVVTERLPVFETPGGAAVLFVGRKTDRTLLAIGRLTQVDGVNGTIITPDTKTVTFEVAALDCGIGTAASVQPGESNTSFLTNFNGSAVNAANTNRYKATMSGTEFDIFKLRNASENSDTITSAEYHFRVNGAAIGTYTNGIIVAGAGGYERKQPRYPKADGTFQYFSVILDDKTIISPRNNRDIGAPFKNPVQVSFNTSFTDPGSMFAFVFQIPVCPLYLNTESGTWYIRPSYDSYWLDLDNSNESPLGTKPAGYRKEAGGAVLITTGLYTENFGYQIRVIIPPNKYLYSYTGAANAPNDTVVYDSANNPTGNHSRYFNVNGLLVALEYFNNGEPGELVEYINNDDLIFEIGMKPVKPRSSNGADIGDQLIPDLYGIQTVKVTYLHPQSGIKVSDSFIIIVDNAAGQLTPIPPEHFIVVDDNVADGDLQNYMGVRTNYNGRTKSTFVIIVNRSFNFQNAAIDIQPLVGLPTVILVVGGRSHTTAGNYNNYIEVYDTPAAEGGQARAVGRLLNNTVMREGAFRSQLTNNSFYFGRWPFNVQLNGRGIDKNAPQGSGQPGWMSSTTNRYSYQQTVNARTVHRSYGYTLNAYGPYTTQDPPGPGINPQMGTAVTYAYFLKDNFIGRLYNVTVDPRMTIYNRGWLY